MIPIAEHLANSGIGSLGETIFIGAMPSDVTTGVMIRPRLVGIKIDHELPGYYKFPFQVIARSTNNESAQELAYAVSSALTLSNAQLSNWKVNYIRPNTLPADFPFSLGELVECNIDFDACVIIE